VDWLPGPGRNAAAPIIFTAGIGAGSIRIFERDGSQSWTRTVIPAGKSPEVFRHFDRRQRALGRTPPNA
jgi:hypothetical protein